MVSKKFKPGTWITIRYEPTYRGRVMPFVDAEFQELNHCFSDPQKLRVWCTWIPDGHVGWIYKKSAIRLEE